MDGGEVGEHAAQPAVVHVGHLGPLGLALDDLTGLLLGADEEDGAGVGDGVPQEVVRLFDALHRLPKVDDVDAVALPEDVRGHLGIPAPGLVPEVDARLQQLSHGDYSHGCLLVPVGASAHPSGLRRARVCPDRGGCGGRADCGRECSSGPVLSRAAMQHDVSVGTTARSSGCAGS